MDTARLVLEYLKALLTGPVIAGSVAVTFILLFRDQLRGLISRIASIKLPGGGELVAPQLPPPPDESPAKAVEAPEKQEPLLPATLSDQQLTIVRELIDSERKRAYIWEYRYLNLFLVPTTKKVLEWFGEQQQRVTQAMFDTMWSTLVPDPEQRRIIITVLESHYLIKRDGQLLSISPKGQEYLEYRDKL